MNVINPLVAAMNRPQQTSWKHMKEKTTYHLRLIDPMNCLLQESIFNGKYLTIAAEVLKDSPLTVLKMIKGERIVVDLPMRCFMRSWYMTNGLFRQNFKVGDSVDLVFHKGSKKDLSFVRIERVEPTPEQSEFARSIYSNGEAYTTRPFELEDKSVEVSNNE